MAKNSKTKSWPGRSVPKLEAIWLDGPVPKRYWHDAENRLRYIHWLGQRLGYRTLDDWYKVTVRDAPRTLWREAKRRPAVDRLRQVEILCRPALEVIRTLDGPGTLFYCDPPYPHATRGQGATGVYAYEMSDDEHRDLAAALGKIGGKVLVSGYPCRLYDELYAGWRLVRIPKKKDVGNGAKPNVIECVWLNY